MGHAQHDAAEYVPKEMREYWEKRDPILLHEKFLTEKKLLDAKTKKEIETKIDALLSKDRDFAEKQIAEVNALLAQAAETTEAVYQTVRTKIGA